MWWSKRDETYRLNPKKKKNALLTQDQKWKENLTWNINIDKKKIKAVVILGTSVLQGATALLVKGATVHYKLRLKFLDRGREYSISIPYKG